ncbi:MAG TPA: hypothetical protein VHH52_09320 [Pseudonocardiaceae bacterium]|nr:hypothetical protein [Pseudonocardiaceae bacterium]
MLCAISALLALAGTALAEPQQLDEAQLGGIAAGQFDISSNQSSFTSTASSMTNTSEQILGQSLQGVSTNTTYSTGVGSNNENDTGAASTMVGGTILP